MDPMSPYERLAQAGILERAAGEWRTTERWQRTFMKAEERMLEFDERPDDLRVPIGYALVDILGTTIPEPELEDLVETMLPIEVKEEREMELDEPEEEEELLE